MAHHESCFRAALFVIVRPACPAAAEALRCAKLQTACTTPRLSAHERQLRCATSTPPQRRTATRTASRRGASWETTARRDERICRTETGASGTWYVLIRTTDATGASSNLGIVCLAPADVAGLATITPAMVRREMERLDWPQARLEVQPPDGQTLINFDTNFFTDNVEPHDPDGDAARAAGDDRGDADGVRVGVRGRGVADVAQSGCGVPRPRHHPRLRRDRAGGAERVDRPTRGRYRINGDAWQTIPGSLTVPGESVSLRVRSASPHLVGTY